VKSERRTSIGRMNQILSAFDYESPRLTLSEVSRRADIPVSSAHRVVRELIRVGALERDAGGKLHIGIKVWRMGLLAPRTHGIQRIALPFMQDVYATTGMPVHLGVQEGGDVIFIESLRPRSRDKERPLLGSRYPLHVTAVGLALLACAPSAYLQRYIDIWADRIAGAGLRQEISRTQAQGFAISRQLVSPGVAVGAAMLDRYGRPLGALSIITPGDVLEASYGHLIRNATRAVERIAREEGLRGWKMR
jgi:DNA-binding IclR family transcriptional regulator